MRTYLRITMLGAYDPVHIHLFSGGITLTWGKVYGRG